MHEPQDVPFGADFLEPCEPCRPVSGGALNSYFSKIVGERQGAFGSP